MELARLTRVDVIATWCLTSDAINRSAAGLPGTRRISVESPPAVLQVSGFLSGSSAVLARNPCSRLSIPRSIASSYVTEHRWPVTLMPRLCASSITALSSSRVMSTYALKEVTPHPRRRVRHGLIDRVPRRRDVLIPQVIVHADDARHDGVAVEIEDRRAIGRGRDADGGDLATLDRNTLIGPGRCSGTVDNLDVLEDDLGRVNAHELADLGAERVRECHREEEREHGRYATRGHALSTMRL
jgi:hypothetical protein